MSSLSTITRNISITITSLDTSGESVQTRIAYTSSLQWADIKDPGVALTTLGVTSSDRSQYEQS
jgi:hypothetical protein